MTETIPNFNISIIIPVFNEEKRITKSLERILAYLGKKGWDFEIIFVEDGCKDNTLSIIHRFQSIDSRIKLLSIPYRLGKGGSIRVAALSAVKKDYVIFMDVDLSTDISELERLIPHIKDHDVIIGSRSLRDNLQPVIRPLHRKIFSKMYSNLFKFLFRIPIYDTQCGFKLFRKDVLPYLFENSVVKGFAFDSELIVKAFCLGLRVKEVPVNWIYDKNSKVRVVREVRYMGSDLLLLWYYYHMLWKQNKATYPQKKGSIYGKILFILLSKNIKLLDQNHTDGMQIDYAISKNIELLNHNNVARR